MNYLLIFFIILSLFCGIKEDILCAETQTSFNENECEVKSGCETGVQKNLPNPGTARLLAIFPGFFIHGMGHFYVGDYFTGGLILESEILAGVLFFPLFFSCWGKEVCPEGILWDILVLGPWIYDIVYAPKKAERIRKEQNVINQIGVIRLGLTPYFNNELKGLMFYLQF